MVPPSTHLSDLGSTPTHTSMSARGGGHPHAFVRWRRCVCHMCVHANRVSAGGWASHPASPAEVEAKHCRKVQQPHPPSLPSPSLVLFQPNLAARPGEYTLTSRTFHCLFPPIPWEVLTSQPLPCRRLCPGRDRAGCHPLSTQLGEGCHQQCPLIGRCGQKGGPPLAQTSPIVFCADFRQPREEDTVVLSKCWNPLINVNWL